jgi:Asp-tRNA(Asn)/Glu-tRNA(Gln) amidotransferase A subunit family amidase
LKDLTTNQMFVLKETTIAKFHEAMQSNAISCAELIEQYLTRIEALDGKLNAVIAINPDVLDEARALDVAFLKHGFVGPLHGVPVLLKDNCETANMPTTAGSLSLEGFHTEQDAFLVKCLRDAGALILAKTNLHEFAIWGETVSSLGGQTRNPYDLTRTPGGSSGGTGAAVAANLGLVGIGTDTVNSIRSPASACCLCGIRPTMGLVRGSGIVPYSLTQDTAGPMARTVEDAVRVLEVIAKLEAAQPKNHKPELYTSHLKVDGLKGKRLGVLSSFFGTEEVNQRVNTIMDDALALMKASGATLVPLDDHMDSAWLTRDVSVHLYELKEHLEGYLNSFADKAPVHSVEEILAGGKYTAGIEENLRIANTLGVDTPEYNARLQKRKEIQGDVMGILDRNDLDALIFPHQQQLVCKIGGSQQQRNGALGSVTGFPAIVVPAGFTSPDEHSPLGVPVGLELLGRAWDEGRLIEIAYGFEQKASVRVAPKL